MYSTAKGTKYVLQTKKITKNTSSGSESLNSQSSPVQEMKAWQDLSVSSSRRNCQSWMGPLPWYWARRLAGMMDWPSPPPFA